MTLSRFSVALSALAAGACGGGGSGGSSAAADAGLDGSSSADASAQGASGGAGGAGMGGSAGGFAGSSGGGQSGGSSGQGGGSANGGTTGGGTANAGGAGGIIFLEDGGVICSGGPCEDLCGPTTAWNGYSCTPCPRCDSDGEVGRYPTTDANGSCICETEPGYFYSTSAQVGTHKCDKDGDGWVRESAREIIDSGDPVLVANANCTVRTVSTITLRNERLQDKVVTLPAPLRLFESDRNDDDALLASRWERSGFPLYHNGGTPPRAATLNSLTKLCHNAVMDYNDNGVPDVSEYGGSSLATEKEPFLRPFLEWSYFAELHRGQFKAGLAGAPDTYIIQEKGRTISSPIEQRVPVGFAAVDDPHWRSCRLARDTEWDDFETPNGFDFADHGLTLQEQLYVPDGAGICAPNDTWEGMNLHSMFKCFLATDTPDPRVQTEVTPRELLDGEYYVDGDYRISICRAQGNPTPVTNNPWLESFGCTVQTSPAMTVGQAYWGAARYIDVDITYPAECLEPSTTASDGGAVSMVSPVPQESRQDEYVRGCVPDCASPAHGCDPIPEPPPSPGLLNGCNAQSNRFGKQTGCSEQCNGSDDNFDGNIDEGTSDLTCRRYVPASVPLTQYLGDCGEGKTKCVAGVFTCEGPNPGDKPELCDGRDNNCDGKSDLDPTAGVLGVGASCGNAQDPDNGAPKESVCALGTLSCHAPGLAWISGPNPPSNPDAVLMCISNTPEVPEDPCNNGDDDCNGFVDETFHLFEGDAKTCNGRRDCRNAVDDDCSGEVATTLPGTPDDAYQGRKGFRLCYCNGIEFDACNLTQPCSQICASASLQAAGSCSGVPMEVCGNGVDDDCDGYIDESLDTENNPWYYSSYILESGLYALANSSGGQLTSQIGAGEWPSGILCGYPCLTEGSKRCDFNRADGEEFYSQSELATLAGSKDVDLSLEPYNTKAKFQLYPPWFDAFQRVLVCRSGRWAIEEVCGVNQSNLTRPGGLPRIPDTPISFGQPSDGLRFCNPGALNCASSGAPQTGNEWKAENSNTSIQESNVSSTQLTCLSTQCDKLAPYTGERIDDCN